MKKLIALVLLLCFTTVFYQHQAIAQGPNDSTKTDTNNAGGGGNPTPPIETKKDEEKKPEVKAEASKSVHQTIKKYFIDGGWDFMSIVMITLILGLAIAIERIITLSLATINNKKFMLSLEKHIAAGDMDGAKNLCKSTAGPTAEVLGEGLRRVDDGVDAVEKTIVANASVQTGLLEKGLVWLSLFIALAPMLGFMGTVVGMIQAFDTIEASNDIRPSEVAGGIKVALLTTVFGLIVAMILQIFYNYITSKVDSIVNGMEDSTIALVDILIDNGHAQPKK